MEGKIKIMILALVAPIFLIPIEALLPYPVIIEELAKWIILAWGKDKKNDWVYPIIAAAVFTISESVLYINKIIMLGNYWVFPQRMAMTGAMHFVTMALMWWGLKKGILVRILTVVLAVGIHWGFNYLIGIKG